MSKMDVSTMMIFEFRNYVTESIRNLYLKKNIEIDLSLVISNLKSQVNATDDNSCSDNIKMVITEKDSNLYYLKQNVLNKLDTLIETGDLVKSRSNLLVALTKELGNSKLDIPKIDSFPNRIIHLSNNTISKKLGLKRRTVLGCMHKNANFQESKPIHVGSLKREMSVFHMI